jgi:hypothetical protein
MLYFNDEKTYFVEMSPKNGLLRLGYQQIATFFNKKALFFAKMLVWLGYSDIFVSIINYKHSKKPKL